jgi:hypothetical protein
MMHTAGHVVASIRTAWPACAGLAFLAIFAWAYFSQGEE